MKKNLKKFNHQIYGIFLEEIIYMSLIALVIMVCLIIIAIKVGR